MLMFLADTVEYGQWKFGKRNESITFSIQPFINKISGALANGILGVTLVVSGINKAQSKDDVSAGGALIFKAAMLLLPLAVIALGFAVYRRKFKIDEKYYAGIISSLEERGDIRRT
jgi:melibiose permease/lactose/raffinose/galactose permease